MPTAAEQARAELKRRAIAELQRRQSAQGAQTPAPETQTIREGVPFMTDDGPAVLRGGQIQPLSQEQFDVATGKTQTAGQIAEEKLGFEPSSKTIGELLDEKIIDRGMILPFGLTKEGGMEFAAPKVAITGAEIGLDIAKAIPTAIATGAEAMRGAPLTGRELVETAIETVVPAAGGIGGIKKVVNLTNNLSKADIKNAKSTKQLIDRGSELIEGYKKTGDAVSGDDFSAFWVKADDTLKRAGFDEETTPAIATQMRSLARRAESETIEPQELINVRRGIRSLMKSPNIEPEDKRLAAILLGEFDDFIMTLPGGKGWQKGRRIYAQGKKSDQIEEVLEVASDTASGLENGIRIELRKILKSEKKSRGFSTAEKNAMRRIVRGDFTANTLKRLSVMAYGSGQQRNPFAFLGSGIGAGVGMGAGGTPGALIGAAVPPAVGSVAQKTLERRTVKAVKALRALAAGARIPEKSIFKDTQLTPRVLASITAGGLAQDEGE